MPAGEHQILFGAGLSANRKSVSFVPSYRFGLTDNLELNNLFGLAYRIRLDERTEIRLNANLAGYLGRTFEAEYSGDPRNTSTRSETATFHTTGITSHTQLGNGVAAFAGLQVLASYSTLYGAKVNGARLTGAVTYDGFGWISLALPVGISRGVNRDDRDESTGGISVGVVDSVGQYLPIASFVVTERLDLFVAPYLSYGVKNLSVEAGSLVGFDWHWD